MSDLWSKSGQFGCYVKKFEVSFKLSVLVEAFRHHWRGKGLLPHCRPVGMGVQVLGPPSADTRQGRAPRCCRLGWEFRLPARPVLAVGGVGGFLIIAPMWPPLTPREMAFLPPGVGEGPLLKPPPWEGESSPLLPPGGPGGRAPHGAPLTPQRRGAPDCPSRGKVLAPRVALGVTTLARDLGGLLVAWQG